MHHNNSQKLLLPFFLLYVGIVKKDIRLNSCVKSFVLFFTGVFRTPGHGKLWGGPFMSSREVESVHVQLYPPPRLKTLQEGTQLVKTEVCRQW